MGWNKYNSWINFNEEKKTNQQNYRHYQLPIVNPYDKTTKYGKILSINDKTTIDCIDKETMVYSSNSNIFIIKTTGTSAISLQNHIKVLRKGDLVIEFTDTANFNENKFVREIGSRVYTFYNNGDLLLMKQDKKLFKFIETKVVDKKKIIIL